MAQLPDLLACLIIHIGDGELVDAQTHRRREKRLLLNSSVEPLVLYIVKTPNLEK